jgi:hypothetical protein
VWEEASDTVVYSLKIGERAREKSKSQNWRKSANKRQRNKKPITGVGGSVVASGVGAAVTALDVMPGVHMFAPTTHAPLASHASSVQPSSSA